MEFAKFVAEAEDLELLAGLATILERTWTVQQGSGNSTTPITSTQFPAVKAYVDRIKAVIKKFPPAQRQNAVRDAVDAVLDTHAKLIGSGQKWRIHKPAVATPSGLQPRQYATDNTPATKEGLDHFTTEQLVEITAILLSEGWRDKVGRAGKWVDYFFGGEHPDTDKWFADTQAAADASHARKKPALARRVNYPVARPAKTDYTNADDRRDNAFLSKVGNLIGRHDSPEVVSHKSQPVVDKDMAVKYGGFGSEMRINKGSARNGKSWSGTLQQFAFADDRGGDKNAELSQNAGLLASKVYDMGLNHDDTKRVLKDVIKDLLHSMSTKDSSLRVKVFQ